MNLIVYAAGVVSGAPDLRTTIENNIFGNLVNVAIGMVGFAAVVMIMYGGIKYMFSQGNEKAKLEAQGILTMAVAGIVIVLSAVFIVRLFLAMLGQKNIDPTAPKITTQ